MCIFMNLHCTYPVHVWCYNTYVHKPRCIKTILKNMFKQQRKIMSNHPQQLPHDAVLHFGQGISPHIKVGQGQVIIQPAPARSLVGGSSVNLTVVQPPHVSGLKAHSTGVCCVGRRVGGLLCTCSCVAVLSLLTKKSVVFVSMRVLTTADLTCFVKFVVLFKLLSLFSAKGWGRLFFFFK